MSILSRYIALAWLRLFSLCLGSFIAIYLVLDMMDKIPRFLKAGGAGTDIFHFFIWKLPEMIGQTASFSILMTTLLTLAMFSRNSEVIAMRSCGISLLRISLPMLTLGLIASILLLLNSEILVPVTYQRMDYIERVGIKKQNINAFFKRNNIWFRSDTMILQARLFEPQKKMLQGLTIWTVDKSMTPLRRIDAEAAEHVNDRWILHQAVVKDFSQGSYQTKNLPALELALSLKVDDLRVLDNNADNLSFFKLKEYAENLQSGGYQAYRYLTMMHTKLASPFAAFVMVILGIPFALRNTRSGGIALGITASIGIGFAYFVVNAILLSYGRSGVIPPIMAAWGANIIFILGGAWLGMSLKD